MRQRGAAILTAMLTVTLVAAFAAAALWQQWRSVEVEAAERGRVQAAWVLTGALDWARLILREDGRSGGPDHLAEPWAVPLREARLSTFLSAEAGGTTVTGDEADNVFLSGEITDLQSRLNVNNLVEGGRISETGLRSFQRLFDLLGLPQGQLNRLAENLRFANDISTDNRSAGQAPLAPQMVDQIAWLGLSPAVIEALRPYVTLLPARTPVNLNTASAEVIFAAVDGLSQAEAKRLVDQRAGSPLRSLSAATALLPEHARALSEGGVSIASRFFEVRGRLRLDRLVVEERSLLQRDGTDVRVLRRERVPARTGLQSSPDAASR